MSHFKALIFPLLLTLLCVAATNVVAEVVDSASERRLHGKSWRPEWMSVYHKALGRDLKRCKKEHEEGDVPSGDCEGRRGPGGSVEYGYFCLFGSQSCVSSMYAGDVHPDTNCTCTEAGTWDCQPFDPQCTSAVIAQDVVAEADEDGEDGELEDSVDGESEDSVDGESEDSVDSESEDSLESESEDTVDGVPEVAQDAGAEADEDGEDGESEDSVDGESEDSVDGESEDSVDSESEDSEDGEPELPQGVPGDGGAGVIQGIPALVGDEWTECMASSSCEDCLADGCAWAFGECIPDCLFLPENVCYKGADVTQCSTYETLRQDVEACATAGSDCETCTSTTVPSSQQPCLWSNHGYGLGSCAPFCGFGGECGSATCSESAAPGEVIHLGCSANDCVDCVGKGCAWAAGTICMKNCGIFADSNCYEGDDAIAVCQQEQMDGRDAQVCSEQRDCAACTGTTKPSNSNESCEWLDFGNGSGICQSSCSMVGCGSRTCPDSA